MTVSYLPSRTRSQAGTGPVSLGLDLTGLGAGGSDDADLSVATVDLARVASYTRAAHGAGVDLVTIGADFRLRSDARRRARAWLDPVVATGRIAPHAGPAGLVAGLPDHADLAAVAAELDRAGLPEGAWSGVELAGADQVDATLRALAARRNRRARPRIVLPVATERDVATAGEVADVVRLREGDLTWAREVRYAVRTAARALGRPDVRVLVDLHAVVAADLAAARARADLLTDIAGGRAPWHGALSVVGTVEDVVDTVERWVGAGAADGFVVVPGSLPADLAALVRGIVPRLRERGLLAAEGSDRGVTRTPVPAGGAARPATAGTAPRRERVAAGVA